ncbi:MAG: hypothetical protein HYZ42_11475 [Bacteroidetes bacterium]|nr:hypothetical protein [Bacteroidota bacterium]
MKKLVYIFFLAFSFHMAKAQNNNEAEQMVKIGNTYFEKNEFETAIHNYDSALSFDKFNLQALSQKVKSFYQLKKYEEAIITSYKAIDNHPGNEKLVEVYITLGNSFDGLKKLDKAIAKYDEGIKKFPLNSSLQFNKALMLNKNKKTKEAIVCFEKCALLNPLDLNSLEYIAYLNFLTSKNIPAILAYSRFLILESVGDRAQNDYGNMKIFLLGGAGVKKNKDGGITISLFTETTDSVSGDTANKKVQPNNFRQTEMILSMMNALNFNFDSKPTNETEQVLSKFNILFGSLKTNQKDNNGFYWEFYAPYFIELYEKGYLERFVYIISASNGDKKVAKWLKKHQKQLDEFNAWSNAFVWKTN